MNWLKSFFSFKWLKKRPDAPKIKEPTNIGLVCPGEYKEKYELLWVNCQITGDVDFVVNKIKRHKARYLHGQKLSGVPWYIIAGIHNMEAGGSFSRNMVNGQRIDRRTTIIPEGLGPWKCWEDSVKQALERRKLPKVWSVANTLYFLEKYNGLGYLKYHKEVNSPYLWSKTNHYQRGKYVSDGRWSSSDISKQVGIVAILKSFDVVLKAADDIQP